MSINKDTILQNKNISEWLDSRIRRRDLCLYCTCSMPFGFVSIRFQIFTEPQQDGQYVDYDQKTAKLGTINVQTQQKI
jgi:hypothetical protein